MIQPAQDLARGAAKREQMVHAAHRQYEDAQKRKHAQEDHASTIPPSLPQKKDRQYREQTRARQMREAVHRFGEAGNRVAVVSVHWTLLLETTG